MSVLDWKGEEACMKRMFAVLGAAVLTVLLPIAAQEKKPQEKLVFKSAMGNVTFEHAKHAEREKGDCKVCHDKLFQQNATAPLNYKANMHKTAEAAKTACAACHVAGGKSFESKAPNCQKCHVKK
jgi:c(7)-type cytochrome triheme protein